MKQKKIFIAVFFILLTACKKEVKTENTSMPIYGFSLEELRSWYQPETGIAINWDLAEHRQDNSVEYWTVSIAGRPKFNGLELGFRKLVFFKNKNGEIEEQCLEIIPDALYLQRAKKADASTFTGRIFVFNRAHTFLKGISYNNGQQVGQMKPASGDHTKLRTELAEESCEWFDNNYVDGEGNAVVFSEQECEERGAGSSGGFGDGSSGSGSSIGYLNGAVPANTMGAGGSSGAAAAPVPSNLPGESGTGINTKDFIKCFGNIPDEGATMKITIYVQEPWPGTSFNLGMNSVGHTAIGLTKSNGNQSITQVVGFYPDATGLDKMHAPSKIVNNGGDLDYNVSVSYTVTADNFQKIADYVANPPATYDLINFNCTNFVYQACKTGNLTLPDPYSTLGPAGPPAAAAVMAPAGIGASIENMKGQSNVNTSGGTTPISKGPCN